MKKIRKEIIEKGFTQQNAVQILSNGLKELETLWEKEIDDIIFEMFKIKKDKKKMWIAKNRLTNEEYGKEYDSAYECSDYIKNELRTLNMLYEMLCKEEEHLGFIKYYNGATIIQCYNKEQKRWADGFDF